MENAGQAADANSIGWNWVWFAPLILFVLGITEWHTVPFAWIVLKVAFERWHWLALISPSAIACGAITIYSIILPIKGAFLAGRWLADRSQPWKRIFPVVILMVLLLALPFITDTLIWGTFPFTYDSAGFGHIRFIPFLPWPSSHYPGL